ncbi:MAG: NAD(P)H-hydrate dehydratase [Bacteroidales bacterium]|nr:NAD(P)H-hydrate dehydratase [Bacteroidales bacterium]
MRNPETTKYDYGHGLLIAGSYGRMGCAILAARAALRSGCGLITVHLPSRCVDPMQAAFPEAMVDIDANSKLFTTIPIHMERYNAIAVGPGIGTNELTRLILLHLIAERPANTPLILDADALNCIAQTPDFWDDEPFGARLPAIITPHAAEYGRLFGDADPAEMARRHNLIIVKKAHRTLVYSPDGRIYENRTGNAGMATAGSGDVLTGMILGLAAQTDPSLENLVRLTCGCVKLHGQIGDFAIQHQSESSLIASDLVTMLKRVTIYKPSTKNDD